MKAQVEWRLLRSRAEWVVIAVAWKHVTSLHSSDNPQSLIGSRGDRTRETLPQSTNTSKLKRFVNDPAECCEWEPLQPGLHSLTALSFFEFSVAILTVDIVKLEFCCSLKRTHTTVGPTPLWFTNADEVGRNILRVRPRIGGVEARMLRRHGNHV